MYTHKNRIMTVSKESTNGEMIEINYRLVLNDMKAKCRIFII